MNERLIFEFIIKDREKLNIALVDEIRVFGEEKLNTNLLLTIWYLHPIGNIDE